MITYERDGVVIRESRESDIAALKNRLREADEKEIIAAGNADAGSALAYSFSKSSVCYTLDINGVPAAMFGFVPDELASRRANVWFLGAPEMSRIKKTFVKLSRHVIAKFLLQYDCLWNVVDVRYASSIAWLKSCGAGFYPKPIFLSGIEFYCFEIVKGE